MSPCPVRSAQSSRKSAGCHIGSAECHFGSPDGFLLRYAAYFAKEWGVFFKVPLSLGWAAAFMIGLDFVEFLILGFCVIWRGTFELPYKLELLRQCDDDRWLCALVIGAAAAFGGCVLSAQFNPFQDESGLRRSGGTGVVEWGTVMETCK